VNVDETRNFASVLQDCFFLGMNNTFYVSTVYVEHLLQQVMWMVYFLCTQTHIN